MSSFCELTSVGVHQLTLAAHDENERRDVILQRDEGGVDVVVGLSEIGHSRHLTCDSME